MSKITLSDLTNLQNENTAVGAINANNTTLEQAIDNTLSRDGTGPNQMGAALDMDSHRIVNLPSPTSNTEPVRLVDLLAYAGGSLTVSPLPTGGTTNQIIVKNSATNYDVSWSSTLTSITLVTPALGTPSSGTLTNCTIPVTGVTGLGTGVATFLATPSSANLRTVITDETGTGSLVFATSPTLVTPLLGTPTSGTLTNCTGLPISSGVSGLGTGIAAFLATPTSANLRAALTDETGTGANVFATSPTIATPIFTGRVPTSSTVTISNASPGVVTWTSHGLAAFTPVFFETTGALPTGLTAAVKPTGGAFSANTYKQNPTLYYVVPGATLQTNSFTVATSLANALAGTSVNTSSAGSGTHTACANAMAPTGTVGEYIYKIVEAGDLFSITSASLGVAYNTISLTAGIWEVGGSTFIWGNGGATAWTHMHASIVYGFTTIASAPFNGTNALHANSNSSNGWGFAHNPRQIFLTGTTTINQVITTDFTGGSGYAYGELWGRRIL